MLTLAAGSLNPAEDNIDGVRIVRVKSTASLLPFLHSDPARPFALPMPDPLVVRAIRRELDGREYDLVHAHNWIVNSALAPVRAARIPLVVTLHEYGHVCATLRFMDHGELVCQGPSLRKCLSCAKAHYGPLRGPMTVAANTRYAAKRSAAISHTLAVSAAVADVVRLDGCAWPFNGGLNADVIPNFIDDALIVDDICEPGGAAPIVYAGALNADKGVATLLEAYGLLAQPPPLVLAGRADPSFDLEFPPGVEAVGPLNHPELQQLFRSSRAVVVPSVWAEPFGIVVLEAMAAGRPVIATSTGGIPEIVAQGATGVLVPPGDAFALAGAMTSLLTDSPLAERLGAAGRDRARDFTVTNVVDNIVATYTTVIADFNEAFRRAEHLAMGASNPVGMAREAHYGRNDRQ